MNHESRIKNKKAKFNKNGSRNEDQKNRNPNSLFMLHNSRSAFTLVELIVTISISVLLTTMLVLYTKTGERQLALFAERSKILGVITQAKTLAIQTFSNTAGDIYCGYGVYISPPTYFVFKNTAHTTGKPSACDDIRTSPNSGAYNSLRDIQIGETYTLNKGVKFHDNTSQTILFIPPDPTVILNPSDAFGLQTVTIETADNLAVKTKIKINDFGQISFDN